MIVPPPSTKVQAAAMFLRVLVVIVFTLLGVWTQLRYQQFKKHNPDCNWVDFVMWGN